MVYIGNTKLLASSECFKFKPTDNQASGVKKCEQEVYRINFSSAERHKSTTSTSSSSSCPPSRARLAASVPQILVKTCWISAALEGGLAAGSKLAGGVPDGIPGVKVDVPGAKVDVPFVKVDVPVVKVDVPGV